MKFSPPAFPIKYAATPKNPYKAPSSGARKRTSPNFPVASFIAWDFHIPVQEARSANKTSVIVKAPSQFPVPKAPSDVHGRKSPTRAHT